MREFQNRDNLTDEEKEFYDFFKSKGNGIYDLSFEIDEKENEGYLGVTLDDFIHTRDKRILQKGMTFGGGYLAVHYIIDCISVNELNKMLTRD